MPHPPVSSKKASHFRIWLALSLAAAILAFPGPAEAYDVWSWLKARVDGNAAETIESDEHAFTVEEVTNGLESPWSMAFIPDGRIFVVERPGRIRIIEEGRMLDEPLTGAPEVFYAGQGGLLDIALHPEFENNRLIYLAYSVSNEQGQATRVSRYTLTEQGLTDEEVVFPGFFVDDNRYKHFGCRIVFGEDGMLYVTLGERGLKEQAQELDSLLGKTLRLTDTGDIPEDNPFVDTEDARPEIFTYGNRNSQGLDVQPGTGLLFASEHGPSWSDAPGGGDEVNIYEAGKNYGWPVIHHRETREGMVSPLLEYTPAIAPSGACFYDGEAFPEWRGSFFFANLVGKNIVRVALNGREVLGQEFLLEDAFGRLRDVEQGPHGHLYVLTSNTDAYGPGDPQGDRLLRLVPAREN
ncbi:PQQ-dependent sugar dehydrogenase [Oceanidesulfovibrio indonesiensis]|uniref:PQQ-dependent sugar dehydrogenase n=1 Tax=Oceanidesulfovibrio indonesiensis TaxID=54767 RepID=A0A7M3MJ49_9BACT|nr:PQQ-dependent sugar dehydrogenase [Oceanidesulfovibrio indonesiensis]TVM19710.1 PQQ-dependent sugar dehydrogenase [Oceanidesulfovibrio indonesiensis]